MRKKPPLCLTITLSLACFWSGFAALVVKAAAASPLWAPAVFLAVLLFMLGLLAIFGINQPEKSQP